MIVAGGAASDAWGVLRADVADRPLLIEHFSRPPSPKELGTSFLKAAWGVEQPRAKESADDGDGESE